MIYLSTAYFPNTQYFSKFLLDTDICIEKQEHYQRRSYRNRCEILAANGKINLQVPIQKSHHSQISNVLIDYSTNWQKQHFKTLESAYQSSPFFEYIIDDFMFVFQEKEKYLLELNNKITQVIMNYLHLDNKIHFTQEYQKQQNIDYRQIVNIKETKKDLDSSFQALPYYQTFNDKFPFVPNLSILDLLFNEGNNASCILKKCVEELKV